MITTSRGPVKAVHIICNPPELAIKQLLLEAQLPIEDITPAHLEHFFGVWSGQCLEGVIGLQPYGSFALLRSLAVRVVRRGSGLGSELISAAERHALQKGVSSIFLLTTSAKPYFEKHGYTQIARELVPPVIRATSQFSSICPTSATVMCKYVAANCAPTSED